MVFNIYSVLKYVQHINDGVYTRTHRHLLTNADWFPYSIFIVIAFTGHSVFVMWCSAGAKKYIGISGGRRRIFPTIFPKKLISKKKSDHQLCFFTNLLSELGSTDLIAFWLKFY